MIIETAVGQAFPLHGKTITENTFNAFTKRILDAQTQQTCGQPSVEFTLDIGDVLHALLRT